MNNFMRMTVHLFCLLGFLAIAVSAHAQCSTPPCVSSFTIAPNVIQGDNVSVATGTVTMNLGSSSGQLNNVDIYGPISYQCMPPASYDGGTSCSPSGCLLPKGVNSLQVKFWGYNTTQNPVTAHISAGSCTINSVQADLTLNPVPPLNPLGPDTPDPCPVCNEGGGNGDGGAPPDGIDPTLATTSGMPINLANGNTYIQQQDYSLPGGRGGLSLGRSWHSMWQALLGTDSGAPAQAGMFGNGWISTYEQRLNLHTVNGGSGVKVWLSSGNSNFFSYNASLTIYTPVSPLTLQAGLTFNASNNTYTYTSHDGNQKIFTQVGRLTALIDRNGNQTTISYDGQNRINQVTDPVGRWIKFNYADSNNPNQATSVYDAVGTIASYVYSNSDGNLHRLLSVTYADGTVLQFQYNDANSNTLVSAVVDGAGIVIEQHTYDSQRRGVTSARALVPASSTTAPVELVTMNYRPAQNQVIPVTTRGGWATYTFVPFGQQNYVGSVSGPGCSTCSLTPADNLVSSYYNPDGTLASRSSGRSINIVDLYTYDPSGNLASKSQNVLPPVLSLGYAMGYQTWQYTYNSFAEVLTATDPLGHATTYAYDTKGNLTSTTSSPPAEGISASVTHFTYDTGGTGLVTQVTDPDNNSTTLSYTPSTQCTNQSNVGLVASLTDARNKTTNFCYDLRGNRTDIYDALGRHTQLQYDGGDRVTQVTYPDLTTTKYAYDSTRGRLHTVTDQNNKVTTYDYDDADRLIKVTDAQTPAAGVTQYGYDTDSNLTSITDAQGRQTTFAYDLDNHLQNVYFPVQGTTTPSESYSFDAVGNLLSKTDRNGNRITYNYDSLNRLVQKLGPGNTPETDYTYDMGNRMTQVTDPTGTYTFSYDNMDRPKQTSTRYSFLTGKTFTVNYTYDAASNRKTMTDAENGVTTYTPDALNRLQTIVDFNNNTFGFGYDDISHRTSLTRQNGVNTAYSYKPSTNFLQGVLHQVGSTNIDGTSYTYDNVGNRTNKTDMHTNTRFTYDSDDIYQLKDVVEQLPPAPCDPESGWCPPPPMPTVVEIYTYDLVGNRQTDISGASYSYNNPWNHLDSANSTSYTYDSNGNTRTVSGGNTYTWDFENHLTQVTLPGTAGTATFKYDPFGRRIQKAFTVNSVTTTTNYIYDGANVVEEMDASGNQVARYSQGPGIDQPLSMTRGGVTSFYEADGLGSITSLTNSAGNITDAYAYDSFGNVTASSGNTINPFRYTGREYDSETGLYYYRARYYDPSTGRFLSEDPISFAGGINFYPYVGNSPSNLIDPTGKQSGPPRPPAPKPPAIYYPGLWGGQFQGSNNCYSYACNRLHPPTSSPTKPQPGGDVFNQSQLFHLNPDQACALLKALATSDGLKDNPSDGCCPPGYFKVKLYFSPDFHGNGPDYHWYRQDSNGGWSSKHGWAPVGPQIDNPDADAFTWGYTKSCGAMCAPNQ